MFKKLCILEKLIIIVLLLLLTSCATTQKQPIVKIETIEKPEITNNLDNSLSDLTTQITNSITEDGKKKIAVIEFSDLEGNVTQFGKYLAEELITRLFRTKKFEVVERQLLNKIISEQKLSITGMIDENSAKELGRILGVDAIVSGTITDLGISLKVNARIISTETGKVFGVAGTKIVKDETVEKLMDRISKPTTQKKKQIESEEVIEKSIEKPLDKFSEGLTAEYFNLPPFSDNPGALPNRNKAILTRIDNNINFDWGDGIPGKNISVDYFGVRWTGMIYIPINGTYQFKIYHDNGVRLTINNKILIDYWKLYWHRGYYHIPEQVIDVYLKGKNWYPIKVEFFEHKDVALIKINWRVPGSDKLEVIPSSNFKTKEMK